MHFPLLFLVIFFCLIMVYLEYMWPYFISLIHVDIALTMIFIITLGLQSQTVILL